MNERGGTTALGAGSLNYNGPVEFYEPKSLLLATNSGGGEGFYEGVITVRVPSSQLRIKGSIVFIPQAGSSLGDIHGVGTVWVAAAEEDADGRAGGAGRIVPITDLEGSAVAGTPVGAPGPTAFPKTDGLFGYAREFVTAAPWLQYTITLNSNATPGAWIFRYSMQPDAIYFPWPAWDELRRMFIALNTSGVGSL